MTAELLWDVAARGTLVAGGAFAATRAMRRSSAASRHLVWTLAIGALLLLPVLVVVTPAWPLPILPAAAGAAVTATVEFGAAAVGVDAGFDWPAWAVTIWLAGFLVLVARLAVAMAAVWRIARRGRPFGARVVTSDGVASPMTWGLRRAVVLLPAEFAQWTSELRRNVLRHELAHARRRDGAIRVLAQLAACLYWFHPLVWLAVRELVKESERACDDEVLGSGVEPAEYAEHLLAVARAMRPGGIAACATAAMARPSEIEGRLLAILDGTRNRRVPGRAARMAAAATALLLVLPLAALQPGRKPATSRDGVPGGASGGVVGGVIGGVAGGTPRGATTGVGAGVSAGVGTGVGAGVGAGVGRGVPGGVPGGVVGGVIGGVVGGEPGGAAAGQDQPKPKPNRIRVYSAGGDVKAPRVVKKVQPQYTREARDKKIEGTVELYVEVWPDGGARNMRVEKALDPGLDRHAIDAVKQWQFEPGTKDGEPVPVAATIKIDFRLLATPDPERKPAPPPDEVSGGVPGRVVGSAGVKAPVLIYRVAPDYTQEAKDAKIEGTVELSADISPEGEARNIRVTRSLDPGLDEKAIQAVEQWKFKPGTKDGEPVNVRAYITVNFRRK